MEAFSHADWCLAQAIHWDHFGGVGVLGRLRKGRVFWGGCLLFFSPMCSNPKEVLEQLGFYPIFFLKNWNLLLCNFAKQRYWNLFLCNFLGSRNTGIQLVFTLSFMILPHLNSGARQLKELPSGYLLHSHGMAHRNKLHISMVMFQYIPILTVW